ncbi:Small heat shock protein HSP [Parasponia andersonii]|uniref:Small heat shock protein HSP n=1 Tax=Parasponia andersonii TaxID=3476 RepID=A0A2P5BVA5_PARAD|nr:Small heat shock protein HSP [Parasponia andersonii]
MESTPSYLDFEPYCACRREEESHIIAVHLHGFKREQLRVQVNDQRILTIYGQRLVDETNYVWSRFSKQVKLPEDCNENGVRAKFSSGILTITMPLRTKTPQHDHESCTTRKQKSDNYYTQSKVRGDDKEKYCKTSVLFEKAAKVAVVVLVIAVSGAFLKSIFKQRSPPLN